MLLPLLYVTVALPGLLPFLPATCCVLFVAPLLVLLGATLLYWLLPGSAAAFCCGRPVFWLGATFCPGLRVPPFIWVTFAGLRVTLPVPGLPETLPCEALPLLLLYEGVLFLFP